MYGSSLTHAHSTFFAAAVNNNSKSNPNMMAGEIVGFPQKTENGDGANRGPSGPTTATAPTASTLEELQTYHGVKGPLTEDNLAKHNKSIGANGHRCGQEAANASLRRGLMKLGLGPSDAVFHRVVRDESRIKTELVHQCLHVEDEKSLVPRSPI